MIPTLIDSCWFQPPFQTTMNLWWPKTETTRLEKNKRNLVATQNLQSVELKRIGCLRKPTHLEDDNMADKNTKKHMKFNICPEKLLSSKESSGPTIVFQVASC